MITFLIILGSLLAYVFLGAAIGARDHAVRGLECKHYPTYCYGGTWCTHATLSMWIGILWPFMFPAVAGIKVGKRTKSTRVERRRARELEEAKHQAELARLARQEDEDLDKRLASLERKSA